MPPVRQCPQGCTLLPPAACVRVRPAFAGEGRYFVRVPVGTNQERWDEPQQQAAAAVEAAAEAEEGEAGEGGQGEGTHRRAEKQGKQKPVGPAAGRATTG